MRNVKDEIGAMSFEARVRGDIARKLQISPAAVSQLRSYVEHAESEGWYWKPKADFDKRHRAIRDCLGMEPLTEI